MPGPDGDGSGDVAAMVERDGVPGMDAAAGPANVELNEREPSGWRVVLRPDAVVALMPAA